MRILIVVLSLVVLLVLAVWAGWDLLAGLVGGEMSPAGWAAAILGTIFTIALGAGLMALVFYSARRGYDERAASGFDDEGTTREVNPPGES
jgi:TRAP-type C4-dicarboxylate transport system permease small subunit